MGTAKNRRLVAVLGMPRSGLTAVTQVLEAMDVQFGLDPDTGGHDRARGSPEAEINESLLAHMGSGRDRLAPRPDIPWDSTTRQLRMRAFQIVSTGLVGKPGAWGLNDPGTGRLIGFWNTVFSALDVELGVVITVRNPASVAASLAAKDAIPAEKAYFLWLQHVLPSVLLTNGTPRLVVDYDRLLGDPRAQIARISAALGLPAPDAESSRARRLESALRESGRRHARHTGADLARDGRASALARSAYRWLDRLAADQESLAGPDTHGALEELNRQLSLALPAFAYINSLEDARRHLAGTGAEHEATMAGIRSTLAASAQILVERGEEIDQLKGAFSKALAARDEHVTRLNASIANTDGALVEQENRLARIGRSLTERDQHVAALHASSSWRLTKPLRWLALVARGAWGAPTSPLPPPGEAFGIESLPSTRDRPEVIPAPPLLLPKSKPFPELDQVPPGFDPQLYLELNPDLSGSFEWAAIHYVRHGRNQGRGFTLPEIDLLNEDGFQSGRETILVVSHEASRTGAPLLTLGLVQANVERYNVVALLLGEGPLRDAFRNAGAAVVMSPRMKANPVVAEAVIRRLHERFNFTFALVNSIESRAVLPALGQHCIPAVATLHEFAAYTRPATAFRDAFFWSSEVVFSTRLTLENAHAELPDLGEGAAQVLPQGRCLVPAEGLSDEQLRSEHRRIRRLMRPKGRTRRWWCSAPEPYTSERASTCSFNARRGPSSSPPRSTIASSG